MNREFMEEQLQLANKYITVSPESRKYTLE